MPAYTIQTVAGGKPIAGSGSATLRQPEGVLLSNGGEIYFADALAHVVRRIATDGAITTVAGTGVAGFSGDGGPATAAQLNQPYGIAGDASGNLYIADLGNARVRVVGANGTINTLAGGGSAAPPSGTGWSVAIAVALQQPRNVAVGPDGSIYISDFAAHQVYRITQGILMPFAGTGKSGSSGDAGPANQASLSFPAGVAVGLDGAVYLADSGNDKIRKVVNGIINTVATLKRPTGVAVDYYGNVYAAGMNTVGLIVGASLIPGAGANDIAADLVGNLAFVTQTEVAHADPRGKVTVVAGTAGPQPKPQSSLVMPAGLAIGSTEDVYIADPQSNIVWKLSAAGTISSAFGDGDPKTLNAPASVAVSPAGTVYIADTGNNRVLRAGADGQLQMVIDQLKSPDYVFADAQGLLIADTGNDRVLVINAAGALTASISVAAPTAAIRDVNGNIYVSERDAGQVVRFSATGWTTPLLLDGKAPAGLALDANGNLLVADSGHNTIRLVAADGSWTTIAGTGTAGYQGDGGPAIAALLNAPTDVKIDARGQVWVADSLNGAVRVLVPAAGQGVLPPPTLSAPFRIVSSASFLPGAIAPGEIVSIFGSGFDSKNTQVTFDGTAAFLFYTGGSQVNALAPETLTPGTSTSISVISDGTSLGAISGDVAATAPGLFTFSSGAGQAAALNQDTSLNGSANPAAAGSIIVLYATGDGPGTVGVSIAGRPADILYAGDAPGYIGLMQINARIPAGTASGATPVVVTIGHATSQDGVTIQVK